LYVDENTVGQIIVFMMPLGLLFSFLPKKDDEVKIEITRFKKLFLFP